jgi:hypothetical protein
LYRNWFNKKYFLEVYLAKRKDNPCYGIPLCQQSIGLAKQPFGVTFFTLTRFVKNFVPDLFTLMLMKLWLILLLCVLAVTASAQNSTTSTAGFYTAMGAYRSSNADVFAAISHQATLPNIKRSMIGIRGQKKFLLKELGFYSAAIAIPLHNSGMAASTTYFGSPQFNQTQLSLAYGKKLSQSLNIGVQFNYHTTHIAGYGNTNMPSIETSVLYTISPSIKTGLHFYCPVELKNNKSAPDKATPTYTVGLGYALTENFFCSTEIVQPQEKQLYLNVGFEYQWAQQFFAKAGTSTQDKSFFAGAGLQWKNQKLELIAHYHPVLGYTPTLLLLFFFKEKNKPNSTE